MKKKSFFVEFVCLFVCIAREIVDESIHRATRRILLSKAREKREEILSHYTGQADLIKLLINHLTRYI